MTMEWKAPPEIAEAFEAALPDDPAVQRRKMFGFPAAFVNANMFAGVFRTDIVARLPAERVTELVNAGHAFPFAAMQGRVMREYAVLPAAVVKDPAELSRWLDDSFRFAAALPAKQPKPRRKK
jgi:TfoX/Sxy family transcriptional regulator of competence genes